MLRDPMSELGNLRQSPEKNELERELAGVRRGLEDLSPQGQRIPHDTLLTPQLIDAGYKAREIYDKHFSKK